MPRAVTKQRRRKVIRYGKTVRDIWGEPWVVGERRPTQYRFPIYLGWPCSSSGLPQSGKAAVIVTAPLATHMRANVIRRYAYPLPIGDNARRRVGERLAERLNVSPFTVYGIRSRLKKLAQERSRRTP